MDARDLIPEIIRECRGCPEPTLIYALKRAARTFCRETWLVRRSNTYSVTPQQRIVQLLANDSLEEVIAVQHAHITDPVNNFTTPLQFVYPEHIKPDISPGVPSGISFVPYTAVELTPPADRPYNLTVQYVVQPSWIGEYIPDELGVKYRQAIGHGALEFIKRQSGNDWFDPQAAEMHRMAFNAEIASGRAEAQVFSQPGQWRMVKAPFMRRGRWNWGGP